MTSLGRLPFSASIKGFSKSWIWTGSRSSIKTVIFKCSR